MREPSSYGTRGSYLTRDGPRLGERRGPNRSASLSGAFSTEHQERRPLLTEGFAGNTRPAASPDIPGMIARMHAHRDAFPGGSSSNRNVPQGAAQGEWDPAVILDQGKYGRFAERWFSKGGRKGQGAKVGAEEQEKEVDKALPVEDKDAKTGAESKEQPPPAEEGDEASKPETPSQPAKKQSVLESLIPRILRSAKMYFSASGFFFSYEHDLSGNLMQKDTVTSTTPLWKRFDPLSFWNRHLIGPFIKAGQDSLVLPLIEGFVGQRAFSIARTGGTEQDTVAEAVQKSEEVVTAQEQSKASNIAEKSNQEDFLLTLISRRSVKRAGLRYLRRGIDDDGNVANSVETEQILSTQSWDASTKSFSLIQIRGSIPLFFSQSPYSFKPMPVMFGSESTNQAASQRHFKALKQRYGSVQVASLVDKHATEKPIGEAYEKQVKLLNDEGGLDSKPIGFEWFDFHTACKGMKFENVSILLDTLQSPLRSFGWIVKQNDSTIRSQTGVVRTNCMDCLDRTNVVQSAIGGWALQQQLAELGLKIDLQTDPQTQWFNTLWADNGDNISKQYAGTAALKGDFTRTRKRNWTGALSDFSLTLNRYYNNIFGDYFLQLNIDFFLGNIGPEGFEDFEADMMGQDYALDMRRVRRNAIETCLKIVLEDPGEDFVAGWTLACPKEANTLRSLPFEECVLLLTDGALYFCRFDWDAEKIGSFERVDLLDVREMWRGLYVTSTLGPTHTDEGRNVGFALRYATNGKAMVRRNTRSLGNEKAAEDENAGKDELEKQEMPEKSENRLLAFKALPPKSSASKYQRGGGEDTEGEKSEVETVKHICDEVRRMMVAAARKEKEADHLELEKVPQVEERDVVSVAEARKGTGYMESLGYSLILLTSTLVISFWPAVEVRNVGLRGFIVRSGSQAEELYSMLQERSYIIRARHEAESFGYEVLMTLDIKIVEEPWLRTRGYVPPQPLLPALVPSFLADGARAGRGEPVRDLGHEEEPCSGYPAEEKAPEGKTGVGEAGREEAGKEEVSDQKAPKRKESAEPSERKRSQPSSTRMPLDVKVIRHFYKRANLAFRIGAYHTSRTKACAEIRRHMDVFDQTYTDRHDEECTRTWYDIDEAADYISIARIMVDKDPCPSNADEALVNLLREIAGRALVDHWSKGLAKDDTSRIEAKIASHAKATSSRIQAAAVLVAGLPSKERSQNFAERWIDAMYSFDGLHSDARWYYAEAHFEVVVKACRSLWDLSREGCF
ncbi:hypothetical protein B0A55_08137 [Friedmanniomyces simplex]|uniref:SAC domain-containing protein n=1 Tax=Friedmanniomyces simplex TaxID=329884 RepID=A0A4U0X032_9PEZI|nr:hypothetical protein B0A55_08137 [Friedmanniomyces simplex]